MKLPARLFLLCVLACALPQVYAVDTDPRYCTDTPVRNADGTIHRDKAEIARFRRLHPCPSTGLKTGSCPHWAIDHPVPLKDGGCDKVFNMQWLPDAIKSCAGTTCKDRWEIPVYKRGAPAIIKL